MVSLPQPHRPTTRPCPAIAGLLLLLLVSACRSSDHGRGDPDGEPVAFVVTLDQSLRDRAADDVMTMGPGHREDRIPGSPNDDRPPPGYRLGFTTTEAVLLIGSRRNDDDLARRTLTWGLNQFELPLRPGREVHLTLLLGGGHRLLDHIGSLTTTGPMRITISASGERTMLLVDDLASEQEPLPENETP